MEPGYVPWQSPDSKTKYRWATKIYGRNNLVNVATLWSYVMILTRYKYEQQYDFMYYTKIWSG